MATSRTQSTGIQSVGSVASVSKAYASNTTAGALLVCSIACYDDSTAVTFTVADTQTNTWAAVTSSRASRSVGGHIITEIFYAKNTVGGANTVTVTPSQTSYPSIAIYEIAGADTATQPNLGNAGNGSGTAVSSGAITLGAAADIVIGVCTQSGSGTTITQDTAGGWLLGFEDEDATETPINSAYRLASSGSQTATWTLGASREWCGSIASFNAAAASGLPIKSIIRSQAVNRASNY